MNKGGLQARGTGQQEKRGRRRQRHTRRERHLALRVVEEVVHAVDRVHQAVPLQDGVVRDLSSRRGGGRSVGATLAIGFAHVRERGGSVRSWETRRR